MCFQPLHAITAKANEFQWEKLHSDAYAKAKQAIANSCMLQYFSSEYPIVIQVDASSIGVGAALMQQGHVVSYHSRAIHPHNRDIPISSVNAMDWSMALNTFITIYLVAI